MFPTRIRGVLALAAAVATPAVGQTRDGKPLDLRLTTPEAEFVEPFTVVTAVRELSDGRVLVSDLRENTLSLLDFRSGTARPVGRTGQGPGEFAYAGTLLPLPGDWTYLHDPANRRFLKIGPDGKAGETVSFPQGSGPGIMNPRIDGKGRIYFQAPPFRGGPDQDLSRLGQVDSAPILRWDPGTRRVDTLGQVKIPSMNVKAEGGRNQRMVMIRAQPFAPQDGWAVAPDGRIAVVRVGDYHVEWWEPDGRRMVGPAYRHEPIKVTEADKKEWAEGMRSARPVVRVEGGGRAAPPPPMDFTEGVTWPEVKPPFVDQGIFLTPEGQLWVLRTRRAGDKIPTYDVFDRKGTKIGTVTLRPSSRVVGFGKGTVYVARTDEDDLQWLERYRR
ncbi:MAG TPA: hypothetical protein VNK43_11315 [Gemmatimonadales bacterium]|nr:hypothetical protein [Gemmatimonadales bacterium]